FVPWGEQECAPGCGVGGSSAGMVAPGEGEGAVVGLGGGGAAPASEVEPAVHGDVAQDRGERDRAAEARLRAGDRDIVVRRGEYLDGSVVGRECDVAPVAAVLPDRTQGAVDHDLAPGGCPRLSASE